MSDNFTWAVDNISSVGYPRVKQTLGADGTATADWAGRAIGSDGVAYVDPRPSIIRLTDASSGLTTATTSYTSGDQVGALQSFSSAFRTSALNGVILGALLFDLADVCPVNAGYDIYFWYQDPTLASDNAAFSVSDADIQYLTAKLEMPAFRDEGSNRSSNWWGAVPVSSTDTSLRYSYVARADHSYFGAATDLVLMVLLQQS